MATSTIYTQFDTLEDIVSNITQTVTEAMWTGDEGTLTAFYTSSTQATSDYYINVYDQNPQIESGAAVQFAVAFGDVSGRGAAEINEEGNNVTLTESKAVYSQYRNLLLTATETNFSIGGETYESIYVINFQRERLKEQLDPGNWELTITTASGSFTYIDNSSTTSAAYNNAGLYYNIVSGSIADGVYDDSGEIIVGRAYMQHGILLFGSTQLNTSAGMETDLTVNSDQNNQLTFFTAISTGASFKARNSQKVKSTYYFVRVKNSKYNYSNNPSFTIQSTGELRHPEMEQDPQVYITTIGLYNNSNELLAVAKISQPLLKNAQREALIKVKLDW